MCHTCHEEKPLILPFFILFIGQEVEPSAFVPYGGSYRGPGVVAGGLSPPMMTALEFSGPDTTTGR